MKAAQIDEYGGKDVVQLRTDALMPEAGPHEVLVAVKAAAINPFDVKVRDGAVRSMAELTFPATLGGDVAGIVSALGENVHDFAIGQEVYGQANALGSNGSLAEYTVVAAGQLSEKPQSTDFVAAAAIPLVACSAYQALIDTADVQTGQKVLIHGGAGGIGSVAIQLAKHLGAHVITTATADTKNFVEQLGADEVIDYTSQDFSELISDCDVVFDTIGGETNKKSYSVLKSGGQLISMVEQPDNALQEQYDVKATAQFTQVTTERLQAIAQLVDDAVLHVPVDRVFTLDEAADALEYQKTGHPRGKVAIRI